MNLLYVIMLISLLFSNSSNVNYRRKTSFSGVIFYSGVSSERIRPDNIAVVVGENWNLFYESSADYFFVNWYVVDANGKRLLFLNGTKVSRKDTLSQRSTVRIHPDGDTILHTLQVNNSELSDAGRYILEDIMAEPVVEVSAEVIILGT